MKFQAIISFILLVLVANLSACKKDTSETIDFNYTYFDLTPKRYITYNVTEITHDVSLAVKHDTLIYQLKTIIGDTVIDNQGRIARKYVRYKRTNATLPWQLKDVWTAIITDNRAELIEENQRVIKLVFPTTTEKKWNINGFNNATQLEAYYAELHQKKIIGANTFDSTLVVEQQNFFSLVDDRRKYEVYAKGIGLVKKFFKDNTIKNFDTKQVQKGKELYYECTSYGFE